MPYRRRVLESDKDLCFDIGRHLVRLERCAEGWSASVDGLTLGGRFSSQAQAWQQGVRAALEIERLLSKPANPVGSRQGLPGDQQAELDARGTNDS